MNRELEQFFTNEHMSRLIASKLKAKQPKTVIDVGAGEGALLGAIKDRWKSARLLGVDIDPRVRKAQAVSHIESILGDGLDHKLPAFIETKYGHIDLAVSNPPYTAIRGNKSTELILKDAGLFDAIGKSKNYPAELVFLAQNLRILKDEGALAIILPSGIINSDRWVKLRKLLCGSHRLTTVIELPDKIFEKTEAKTYALILQKGGRTRSVRLLKTDEEGVLSSCIKITARQAVERMDFSYYLADRSKDSLAAPHFTLRELGAQVFRGQLSCSMAKAVKVKLFHTSDMGSSPTSLRISGDRSGLGHPHAIKKGDIIVARVGTRCIGRMCFISGGYAIASDSVYVIRLAPEFQQYAWKAFSSENGIEQIKALCRGVCAKYVTKDQLLDLPL